MRLSKRFFLRLELLTARSILWTDFQQHFYYGIETKRDRLMGHFSGITPELSLGPKTQISQRIIQAQTYVQGASDETRILLTSRL